jgi:Ser/Thr protein kinase RdoA (MazF antagonist)
LVELSMNDIPLCTAIAAIYPDGDIVRCDRIERTASDLIRIEVPRGARWLKLASRSGRTIEELEAEAEIVACLADSNISVAAPVRRLDGRYAGPVALPDGVYSGTMFCEAPGVEVASPSQAQARALGTLIANVHLASPSACTNRWTIDATTLCLQPLCWIHSWIPQIPELVDVRDIGSEMIARIWGDKSEGLPTGLCHGDLHLENVWFDGLAPTLFDFEVCGMGPLVYDLACYWRKRVLADETSIPEWEALLDGYNTVRALTPEELHAIPALATLRAIWTMALPASPISTWGRDWLDSEYFAAHISMIKSLAHVARSQAVADRTFV